MSVRAIKSGIGRHAASKVDVDPCCRLGRVYEFVRENYVDTWRYVDRVFFQGDEKIKALIVWGGVFCAVFSFVLFSLGGGGFCFLVAIFARMTFGLRAIEPMH